MSLDRVALTVRVRHIVASVEDSMTPNAKRYRLVLILAILVLVAWVFVAARGALFPFMLSGAVAYVLFPLVQLIETRVLVYKRWQDSKRLIAVAIVYVLAIGAIVGIVVTVVPPVFEQGTRFVESSPEFFAEARMTLERWAGAYGERVPDGIRDQVQGWLEGAGEVLIGAVRTIALRTLLTVVNVLTVVLGLAVVPLFLFFALKDGDRAIVALTSSIPGEGRRHAANVLRMINLVFAAYLRAQLTLAIFVAVSVSFGLFVLGVPNALLLGLTAGLFEFVPVVGPLLGLIPGVVVTLASLPEVTFWVLLLYGGVQVIQNMFLVPRVQGRAVKLNPAVIMVAIVVGSEAAGVLGVVLAVPVTAAMRNVIRYFYQEWSEAPIAGTSSDTEQPVDPEDSSTGPA